MTARRDEPVVLIIDRLPLRSLNLINILSHLDSFGRHADSFVSSYILRMKLNNASILTQTAKC